MSIYWFYLRVAVETDEGVRERRERGLRKALAEVCYCSRCVFPVRGCPRRTLVFEVCTGSLAPAATSRRDAAGFPEEKNV